MTRTSGQSARSWIPVRQAGVILKLSPRSVRDRIEDGTLSARHPNERERRELNLPGNAWLVLRSSVEKLAKKWGTR